MAKYKKWYPHWLCPKCKIYITEERLNCPICGRNKPTLTKCIKK